MGVGTKVSLGLGRLLELGRRGVWIESQAQGRGIYLFLFGAEAELTAWLLPSRATLDAAAVDLQRKPLLVVVTDQLSIARKCEELGHFPIYFNIVPLRERMATLWLKNFLLVQFTQIPPEAVYFSPYFFPRIPRPRHLGHALAAMLRKFSRDPLPHLLMNELETDYKVALIGFYELWKAGNYSEPAGVHYFGDPAYLDVSSLFADKEYLRAEPLGWRIDRKTMAASTSKNGRRRYYLWLRNSLVAREVEQTLRQIAGGLYKNKMAAEFEVINLAAAGQALSETLELIAREPGIVVADTYAPLLPLLSMGSPVALLRGPSRTSQMGLVKYSFFTGQTRWPVLVRSEDLSAVAGREEEWWKAWEYQQTQLERTESSTCEQQFIEKIYLSVARKTSA